MATGATAERATSGSVSPAEAVRLWRRFATRTLVNVDGQERTWAEHIRGRGRVDEDQLVQPRVFPAFARALLDFEVGVTLAAEQTRQDIRPDFTPADARTHPFVFEVKGTSDGVDLEGHRTRAGPGYGGTGYSCRRGAKRIRWKWKLVASGARRSERPRLVAGSQRQEST